VLSVAQARGCAITRAAIIAPDMIHVQRRTSPQARRDGQFVLRLSRLCPSSAAVAIHHGPKGADGFYSPKIKQIMLIQWYLRRVLEHEHLNFKHFKSLKVKQK
jgi:hypothetical protein